MSYTFVRHYTKKFEVTLVYINFMKYSSISKVRKDVLNCGLCGTEFEDDDYTHLAFVEGHKNKLICDTCAHEAIAGGAEKGIREEKQ